jgi:uncharacterized protein YkwD
VKYASLSRILRLFAAALVALAISIPVAFAAPQAAAAQGSIDFARYGFTALSGQGPDSLEGLDLEGTTRRLDLAGGKLVIVYLFKAGQSSTRQSLAALEKLKGDYKGRLLVAAFSPDSVKAMITASFGLSLSYPLLSSPKAAALLGLSSAPSFLLIGPGGRSLAKRSGSFDWAGAPARRFVEEVLAAPQAGAPEEAAKGPPAAAETPSLPPAAKAETPYLDAVEAGVVAELNLARSDPKAYAIHLKEYRSLIHGGVYQRPGQIGIQLQEGTRAVDEAIAFLEKHKPERELASSHGLSRAAKDQAIAQGKSGATGHSGADGSTPFTRMGRYGAWSGTAGENISYGADDARAIVIQLLDDDGVASRGHRANIFNEAFAYVGVGFGKHPAYGAVCVLDFAGGYAEKPE